MRRQWLGILRPPLALPTRLGLLGAGLVFAFLAATPAHACTSPVSVCTKASAGAFHLIRGGVGAQVMVDDSADRDGGGAGMSRCRGEGGVSGEGCDER